MRIGKELGGGYWLWTVLGLMLDFIAFGFGVDWGGAGQVGMEAEHTS